MRLTSMQKHRHRHNGNVSHTKCINNYATQFRFTDPVAYKVNQTHSSPGLQALGDLEAHQPLLDLRFFNTHRRSLSDISQMENPKLALLV